jgi:hypothetical protein
MSTWVVSLVVSVLSFLGAGHPASETAEMSAEHAARLYRIEVYNTFRTDRNEYDYRRAVGDQVWAAFEAAGQPPHHRATVTQWFIAAREASAPSRIGELPAVPDFSRPDQVTGSPLEETYPVATSALPQRFQPSPVQGDVVTTLKIDLPPGAEPVGPRGFFSTLVKSVFEAAHGSPGIDESTPPVIVELPRTDKEVAAPATEIKVAPAPESKPEATRPEPTKPTPAPKAEPAMPVAEPAAAADTFDVSELFEPATTPAETTKSATDADPFAP